MNRFILCVIVALLNSCCWYVHASSPTQEAIRNLGNSKAQTKLLTEGEGEHLVRLTGHPKAKFQFRLRPATVRKLSVNEPETVETSDGGSLNTWEFEAKPDQFRVITVSRSHLHSAQLVMAPLAGKKDKPLMQVQRSRPPMSFLPVDSKGDSTKYAVVFGISGKFQLQTYSSSSSVVKVSMVDPTLEVDRNESSEDSLPLGDAGYYGFAAKPGDVLTMQVASETFDSVLRLFDQSGNLVAENDDFKESRNSQIRQLITKKGYYRWQITSLGNGGGGKYEWSFNEAEKKQLAVGQQTKSQLKANSTDYWTLSSSDRKPVFIQVRSSSNTPNVQVSDADGRYLTRASSIGGRIQMATTSLAPDQPITIWVTNTSNQNSNYEIRVLDAGWEAGD